VLLNINWEMLAVFIAVFAAVTILGFRAARWRPGDLNRLQEWGLGGRRFGTITSWFLLGGDVYTAYSFIAVPALVFGEGALGFFAIPYLIIVYPLVFVVLPRFWIVARHRGYVTPADFVRERFGSSTLALLISITGILATMPYIALQIYGIQISIAQMGIPVEISLIIAFGILTFYTYISGLRAPAMISIVKDGMIWLVVLIAFIYIPTRLGGFGQIFASVHQKALQNPKTFHDILPPSQYSAYATLALGSALSLFLYPHILTGTMSTNSRKVVKRNAALLPAYSLLIGLIALLGYMAVAAGIQPSPVYKNNIAMPALFAAMFPPWFAGFSFAAISIGALVPAAIMSIASANLFTRNIYREYFRPTCTEQEESNVAKTTSAIMKIGALAFILFLPSTDVINFQLLSNIWIVQTLPAVFLGLYTNRFHRLALISGWVGGMIVGTGMIIALNFESSVYPLIFAGVTIPVYAAIAGLVVNLILTLGLTPFFRTIGIPDGQDVTTPADYEAQPTLNLQGPAPGAEQPVPQARQLWPDSRQPAPDFQWPTSGSQQPAPGLPQTIPGSLRPAPGFQQPLPASRQPALRPQVGQYLKRQ